VAFRSILIVIALVFAAAWPARAEPFRTERVELELVRQTRAVQPGSVATVALRVKLAPGWHTYWRNAGDAGLPAELRWSLPPGWSLQGQVWPLPGRMPEGPLMTYGWENEVYLPFRFRVPASARAGETVRLSADATVLVCKDICVPENATLALDVPVGPDLRPEPVHGQGIAASLAAEPRIAPAIRAAAVLEGGKLKLAAWGGPLAGARADGAYFYAFDTGVVRHAAVQSIERGPAGLTLTLEPGKDLAGALKGPVRGVLATSAGAWEISAAPGPIPTEPRGLGAAEPAALGVAEEAAGAAPAPTGLGLPLALALAFLGGLILNLMPCVFPVLAMKGAALASHAHAPAEARRDGIAFTAGVLTTFAILALVLVAARAAGEAAGWGFQLQSPWTIAFLTLLMLAVGLNLSGVFHAGLSLQRAGALNRWSGTLGAFLTGALAVVVAAPCFAPFMTEAVGYGLTHSAVEAVLVFLTLGFGFALPFLALSLSPALARRLPKPGRWMDGLKRLLAFPMYGAAAWLAWVFAQQTGAGALGLLFAAGVLLALALYLFGRGQVAEAEERKPLARYVAAAVAFLVAGFLAAQGAAAPPPKSAALAEGPGALKAEPWSPERVAALRAEGRPVLVNFTAAWCVTCKVNERGALESRRVTEAFQANNAAYLVADWTRRDDRIARELARHGRSGVPLYLVYRPESETPVVLPQLLTESAVVRALDGE